jgi:hypothetical protein
MNTKLLKLVIFGSMGMLSSNLLATNPNDELDPTLVQLGESVSQFGQAIAKNEKLLVNASRAVEDTFLSIRQGTHGVTSETSEQAIDRFGEAIIKNKKEIAKATKALIETFQSMRANRPNESIPNEEIERSVDRLGKAIMSNGQTIVQATQSMETMVQSIAKDLKI